jgi:hypothetical protein
LEDKKSDPDRIPSLEERMQMSYDLFKIGNVDMAHVLSLIETKCPNALSRKLSTDEVLINLDALTSGVFHEINTFVQSCLVNISNKTNKNKKQKTSSSVSNLPLALNTSSIIN